MEIILHPPSSPVVFSIFNLDIRYYGLIMAFSIFLGIFLSYFLIKNKISKESAELFLDNIPFVIFSAIFGARLFYVIGDFNFYIKNPTEIIMLNHGGLSIWGAILFGICAAVFIFKKEKTNLYKYLDIFAVSMPLCQSVGRWGNFFNQEAYGKPTDSFLKLFVDYKYRYMDFSDVSYYHPAFLYESILNFILFVILIILFLKAKNIKNGSIFYLYLIFYSLIRIFVESMRMDSILYFNSIPVAQIISFLILIISIFLLFKKR